MNNGRKQIKRKLKEIIVDPSQLLGSLGPHTKESTESTSRKKKESEGKSSSLVCLKIMAAVSRDPASKMLFVSNVGLVGIFIKQRGLSVRLTQ